MCQLEMKEEHFEKRNVGLTAAYCIQPVQCALTRPNLYVEVNV
jgi:hypothetical protein